MVCRTVLLWMLLQLTSIPKGECQFATLEGRTFMVNGQAFYPRVMNYEIDLVSDQMNSAATMDLFISPAGAYDSSVWSHYECGNSVSCDTQLREHFEMVAEMGFNTVRVGLGPRMRKDDQGNWFYSLQVKFNDYPNGTDGAYRLDLDTPDFTTDLSLHFFSLLRNVLNIAQDAGVMVILICADDEGGMYSPYQLTMAWNETAVHLYTDYLRRLAFELKDHPALLAYDLWNEPIWTNFDLLLWKKEDVCQFTAEWYDAIQEVDGNHLVTLGGSGYHELGSWDPAVMKIDFYSPHEYPAPSFLDGYNMVNAVERTKAQLYWQSRTSPMPWLLGETGFSAEDDAVDPLDFYVGADNQHLTADPETHAMPWMNGTEAQQSEYAITTMDATRNYLGSGYSWWSFQNTRAANLNSRPQDYLGNWFGPLKFGNEADPNRPSPWDTTHRWRPKEMVAAIQAYTEPPAPAVLPSPPQNYYNWQALAGPVYRTYGMHDQNDEPIVDGLVTVVWWYKSVTFVDEEDEYLWNHLPTDVSGQSAHRVPPSSIIGYFAPVPRELHFNASGAWRKTYAIDQWPVDGHSELLHRNRLDFSGTIDNVTVAVGAYDELEAWSELTLTNTVIEGGDANGGSANIRARGWVHIAEDFHAQLGSEVHIYTDETWPDCNSEGYASQMTLEPQQLAAQPGQAKNAALGLVLRFQPQVLSIAVYPNPCSESLKLTTNAESGNYALYDMFGRILLQRSFSGTSMAIPTSFLAAGTYHLQVNTMFDSKTLAITKLP